MQTYSEFSNNIVTLKPNINHIDQPAILGLSDKLNEPTDNNTTPFYQTLRGTIVPPEWKSIHTKDGKKLSRGALELYSIIVSWHNYKKNVDRETGKVTFSPKFEGNELKKNYDYFTSELDRSQEQVRRYFAELKAANLVTMELKTVRHKNWKYHNTLCIILNKEAPHFAKVQNNDCKSLDENSCVSNVVNTTPSINQFSAINCASEIEGKPVTIALCDKKIWASPLKKVGFTPQKSGVYIENNYSKTIENRSDLDKSIFVEAIASKPSEQPLYNETQINQIAATESRLELLPEDISKDIYTDTNYPINSPSCFKKAMELGLKVTVSDEFFPSHLNQTTQQFNFSNFAQPRSLPRMPLSSFYPLTEEDGIFLRKASGRPFSLSFINKLLLKLSVDYPDRGFYKKSLLLSYLTSSLIREKRDACEVSCESFNFKAKRGTTEYDTKIQNDYLNAIELSPETNIATKIKRRIIGLFNDNDAYNITTTCRLPYIADNYNTTSYKIEAPNSITETQRSVLTQAVQDILGKTTEVIFKEKEDKKVGQGSFTKELSNSSLNSEPIISSSPLWQKIREKLKLFHGDKGEALDKSWFSKLDIEQNPDSKQIQIKAPTIFMRDWVRNNFSSSIEGTISELTKTGELSTGININNKSSDQWLAWSA